MLKVRIGAALDSSVQAVFKQLPTLARQARAQVETELNKMGGSPYRDAPAHAKKDLDKVVSATKDAAGKGKDEFAKMGDAAEKAAKRAGAAWESAIKGAFRSSTHTFSGIAKAGLGVVGGMARGAGVNLDLGGLVVNALKSQDIASTLSRKGFQEGQGGIAGQKQDPGAILKDMRTAADATAHSTEAVGDAMLGFVNKSGDLDLARKMIGDIGMLANSTGADFKKLAEDAGVLALKMGDSFGGDQAKQIEFVNTALRDFSAQGKLGAIDMAELAAQLPKLAAAASQFKGDPQKLLQTVGFLAQESAKAGGSGSAAQAATAVAALPRDLAKKANRKAFANNKIDLFADKEETAFRDPLEIIKDSIFKTKGSRTGLGSMFQGSAVYRSVEGLRTTYNKAGGGAAGEAAVNEEIKKLGEAALSAATVQRDNAERMKESTAKAQLFNNRLEQIAGSLADRLLPQLEKAAPSLVRLAEAGASLAGFLSEHLGATIVAAAAASIGKAALGQAIGSILKGILSGGGASGGGLGAGGPIGAAMGVGAAIGAGAVTQAQVATDNTVDRAGAKQDEIQQILADAKKAYKEKRISKEQLGSIQQLGVGATDTNQRVRDAENASSNPLRYLINRGSGILGSKGAGQANRDHNTGADKALEAINSQQLAVLRAISSGVLRVEVVNPTGGAPGVAPGGRTNVGAPSE